MIHYENNFIMSVCLSVSVCLMSSLWADGYMPGPCFIFVNVI